MAVETDQNLQEPLPEGVALLMAKVRSAMFLKDARQFYVEGRFAIAELTLRNYPPDGPDAAEAASLRGRALLALNLPGPAVKAFREALEADPDLDEAIEDLRMAEAASHGTTPAAGPRYLVIREWMEGFWSDVDHVIGACTVAEAAGRTPIVHWGVQSRYCSANGDNAWTKFFRPLAGACLDDARNAGSFYPPRWNAENLESVIVERGTGPDPCSCALDMLGRTEDVVVSDFHCSIAEILPYLPADHPAAGKSVADARMLAIERYLRPIPKIAGRVEEFVSLHFGPGPMLGVHFRELDKGSEQNGLDEINAGYPEAIERQLAADPAMKMFLMTDSETFASWCRATYGTRVVTTSARRADGSVGLHFMAADDRAELGVEVLIDTLLAARCDRFIGLASSNVSLFVRDLKPWPTGTCHLFSYPYNDHPNTSVKLHHYLVKNIA